MLLRFSWTSLNYVNLFILKRRPWKPLTRELRTVRGRRKKYGAENYGKPQKWVIIERTIRFWLLTYDGVIGPSDSLRIRIYFYSNNIICNILLLIFTCNPRKIPATTKIKTITFSCFQSFPDMFTAASYNCIYNFRHIFKFTNL